jgi:predicted nucleic acid-binding protein
VKLALSEEEHGALRVELSRWSGFVSSVLLGVEAIRACGRFGRTAEKDAREWLDGVSLLPLDDAVLDIAVSLTPWELRTLDALHLATAVTVEDQIGAFISYDRRLSEAAADHGFAVLDPGRAR